MPPKNVVECILAWRMPLSANQREQEDVSVSICVLGGGLLLLHLLLLLLC